MATQNAINSQDPIQVALGGTGAASFTANGVLLGNSTSAVAVTAAGTAGQLLVGATSAEPAWVTPTSGSGLSITTNSTTLSYAISAPVSIANGGTNATSMTNTDGVVYFDGTRLVTTAVGTATYVLTSNGSGVAPTFQAAGGGGVPSIAGTTNQITETGSPGATTLSIPSTFTPPGNIVMNGANSGGTVGLIEIGSSNFSIYSRGGSSNNFFINDGAALGNIGSTDTNNMGIGIGSLANLSNNGATYNVAIGRNALNLVYNTPGNVGIGYQALAFVSGSYNVAIGHQALNTTENNNYNIGIGYQAGTSQSGNITSNNNIYINNPGGGAGAESNVLRIGAGTGTSTQQINSAFISGIQTITVTGTAVLVSTSDQLGVAISSQRYKENICDMDDYSSDLHLLRPVTFTYKVGEDKSLQSGLIAEEVARVMPGLVVNDKEGLPQTVKYHDLPALLLNELQKAWGRINLLSERIEILEASINGTTLPKRDWRE
jgi:hypothetical protein